MARENTARNLSGDEEFPEVQFASAEQLTRDGFELLDSFDMSDPGNRKKLFNTMDSLHRAGYDVHFADRGDVGEIWAKDSPAASKARAAVDPTDITTNVAHLVRKMYVNPSQAKSKRKGGRS